MSYSVTKWLHFCKMSENSMTHIHIFLENCNGNLCVILSHDDLLGLCVLLTQIYGEDEWSFGFWEQGTGVFSCPSRKNMIRKKLRPVKTMSFKANGSRSSSHINFLLIIVLLYITFWFSILHIFGSIIVLI
ncbi:hypothetical protein S245_041109 [Arachis hypogaea]|nr:uncharacterized protein DS421_12g378110 [Arachis hypogaea]